jgi:hypothetical protein
LEEKGDDKPIPLFLALNEYNNVREDEKKSRKSVIRMLCRSYFNKVNVSPQDEDLIWTAMQTPIGSGGRYVPSIILLLDGFNEITVDCDFSI